MTRRLRSDRPSTGSLVRSSRLLAAAMLVAGWWITLAPASLGGPATYVVIRGDSMLPTIEGGDLVIVRPMGTYGSGDVVAYRVPAGELGAGRIVIHRIVGGDERAGFVVQGDNNPAADPWLPGDGEIVGSAWIRLPSLGRVLAMLHQPAVAASLAAALAVCALTFRWQRRLVHAPSTG